MSYTLDFPINYIANPDKFGTISLGKMYVGVADGNPAFTPADRIQVYLSRQNDTDLPIAQPIDLSSGGVPVYNGSPALLKINQEYSVQVLSSLGVQVYYCARAGESIQRLVDIENEIDNINQEIDDINEQLNHNGIDSYANAAELRLLTGAVTGRTVYIQDDTISGIFVADTTSSAADDGEDVIVTNDGIRFLRDAEEMRNKRDKTVQIVRKSAVSFAPGTQTQYSAIVLLGDSNSEGAGTSSGGYEEGFAGKFVRAIHNAYDRGINTDRGFQFESILNLSKAGVRGLSSDGTLINGGMCDSRLSLGPGKKITITGREISSADVFYEAGLSTGQLQFSINGAAPYKTETITGTGTKDTALGNPGGMPSFIFGSSQSSFYIKATDVLTITSVGGTVVITEVLAIRTSSNAPLIYSMVRQGWGFQDFYNPSFVSEMASHVLRFANNGNKLVLVCLGTNNQNGVVGRQLSPTDYITALDLLISRYRTALNAPGGFTRFAVWVPHKTLDARPLGTYEQYIDAVTKYCENSIDTQCIRIDLSAVGYNSAYLADNRHFNDIGHSVVAHEMCSAINIPGNFLFPARVRSQFTGILNSPTLFGVTTAGTNTYTTQSCLYLAEGSTLKFKLTLALATKDAAMAGSLRIATFMPQAQGGGNEAISVGSYNGITLPAGRTQIVAEMLSGFGQIRLLAVGSGVAPVELLPADITASFSITLSGVTLAQQ